MAGAFTILGRGRAGRALAEAWGDRVTLLHGGARPVGPVLLAVPDHAIAWVAEGLEGPVVHLSGSFHQEGLASAHPLVSFDGTAKDWAGVPLALTGEVPAPMVQAFRDLGFLPFELPPHLKPLYHACAVLTSAHAATLWLGAGELLAQAGVHLPGRGLLPLVQATLDNIARHGVAGLTGPFVRGDEATIQRDVEALPEPWARWFLELGHASDPMRKSP